MMTFLDFIINQRGVVPQRVTDLKAEKSFTDAVAGLEALDDESRFNVWLATLFEKRLTPLTRKRYFAHLSYLYKKYAAENDLDDSFLQPILAKSSEPLQPIVNDYDQVFSKLTHSVKELLNDAMTHPHLAVWLYMLFDARGSIEDIIYLKTESYSDLYSQLDDIVDSDSFHHRRRYVFNLSQSQKRSHQLVREMVTVTDYFLSLRGLNVSLNTDPQLSLHLWIKAARAVGVSLPDVRAIIGEIPNGADYLSIVKPSKLMPLQVQAIKQKVADAICPAATRWYALKLNKGVTFESLQSSIKELSVAINNRIHYFYPQKETILKQGNKRVKMLEPYIPGIVFFKIDPRSVSLIDKLIHHINYGWVFRVVNTADSDYSIISQESMKIFQRAIGKFSADIKVELINTLPIEAGSMVKITGGILEGQQGEVYGIKPDEDNTGRLIFIKLASDKYLKVVTKVEEVYVEPLA